MFDFDQYYYPNVCHVCKLNDKNLKTCTSCRSYRYCSTEHQRIHWPKHKNVCAILNRLNSTRDRLNAPKIESGDCRIVVKTALERELNRPLSISETQLWMFPRVCVICGESDSKKLIDCAHCPVENFCANHVPPEIRTDFCKAMTVQRNYYYGHLKDEFFSREFLTKFIPELNIPILQLETEIFDNKSLDELDNLMVRRSEKFSHVFTVLHALKSTRFIINGDSVADNIIVHIVGATNEYENFDRQICEFLFHWMPKLDTIRIIFVGPELVPYECDNWSLCPACHAKNVYYDFKNSLYFDYRSSEYFTTPDLIAVFNCGFDEFVGSDDTWKQSLPLLTMKNIPLLITSYTHEEALRDFNKLIMNLNAGTDLKVVERYIPNKYRSSLPLRDWMAPNSVYYVNNYLSIVSCD